MWLVTTQGFYSAVEHRDDPDLLLIRCRVKRDLMNLDAQVPGLRRRVYCDLRADYMWRAEVTREEWRLALARLASDVTYPNFKDAVAARQGARRAMVYHSVWSVLLRLERRATDWWMDYRDDMDTSEFGDFPVLEVEEPKVEKARKLKPKAKKRRAGDRTKPRKGAKR